MLVAQAHGDSESLFVYAVCVTILSVCMFYLEVVRAATGTLLLRDKKII